MKSLFVVDWVMSWHQTFVHVMCWALLHKAHVLTWRYCWYFQLKISKRISISDSDRSPLHSWERWVRPCLVCRNGYISRYSFSPLLLSFSQRPPRYLHSYSGQNLYSHLSSRSFASPRLITHWFYFCTLSPICFSSPLFCMLIIPNLKRWCSPYDLLW